MAKPLNLIGQKFGRLLVLSRAPNNKRGHTRWNCVCECGNECVVLGTCLTSGMTQSCGCLWREAIEKSNVKHGMARRGAKNHIVSIYRGMICRCEKPNSVEYHNYGARGIKVCAEWHDFKTFAKWALANGCTDEKQIDRINNDGDYCPANCRFVTPMENANNRRTNRIVEIEGRKFTLAMAARHYGCPYWRVINRLKAGHTGLNLVREHVE